MKLFRFDKLSHKIFAAVMLGITGIITAILLFQLLFIDEWYYERKFDRLTANIEHIVSELSDVELDDFDVYDQDIYPLIEKFEEQNGTFIDIQLLDQELVFEDMPATTIITVHDSMDDYYYIFLEFEDDVPEFLEASLLLGNEVVLEGLVEEDLFFPVTWNGHLLDEQSGYVDYDPYLLDEPLATASMTIVEIQNEYYETADFVADSSEWLENDTLTELYDGFYYYVYDAPFSGVQTLYFVMEFEFDSGQQAIAYVEAPLQSMQELIVFTAPFYVIFYVSGLILAIIISQLIARGLSKPIIAIKEKAEDMAQLDFSEPIIVKGNDELSQLSLSINQLSIQLDNALIELSQANQQLLRDIEKERSLEASRKEFVARVSHDLKTPLGIAKGYIEAILDGIREEKHDEYLKITLKEIDRINQIVLNMLELIKLESAENEFIMKPQPLMPYFNDLKTYFEVLLESKEMTVILPEAMNTSVIDSRTFKTLIMNLVSNAIHYGQNGTDIIIKAVERTDRQTIIIENTVEHPETIDLDKIWHKFYTADQSRNRLTSGTGLGLSIVKSILEQYGSTYNVYIHNNAFVFEFTLKTPSK